MSESRGRLIFMAKYGNADAITRLIHSKLYMSPEMVDIMNNNKFFNKRHLAALFDTVPQSNTYVRHDSLMVAMAHHPWAHPSQLEKLVKPHLGYPFHGNKMYLWPDHAKIAKSRLDTWHLDRDEE